MTLGLFASGRTTRILVPLTLLDACLVRAIVLFLAAPLVDISIFQPGAASDVRAAASGFVPALCSLCSACSAQLAELLESPGRNRTGPTGSFFWQECRTSSTIRGELARKILGGLEGSRFVVVFPCDYALAADLRVEIDS